MYKQLNNILPIALALFFGSMAAAQEKQDGRVVIRYENGQKEMVAHYRDGKKHGRFKYWFDTGQKKQKSCYKNDKLEGKYTTWYKNGNLNEKKKYDNGKLDGWYILWTSSGKLLDKCHYVDDKRDGKCYNYHYGGQLNWEKTFADDSVLTYHLQPLNEVARQWLYFNYNSTELSTDGKQLLDGFITKAKAQPDYPIRVQGYRDFEENDKLSFDRTKAIHDYMVSQGINSERMTIMAYEEKRPLLIKQEAPQKEKNKNKRVEIYLVTTLEF